MKNRENPRKLPVWEKVREPTKQRWSTTETVRLLLCHFSYSATLEISGAWTHLYKKNFMISRTLCFVTKGCIFSSLAAFFPSPASPMPGMNIRFLRSVLLWKEVLHSGLCPFYANWTLLPTLFAKSSWFFGPSTFLSHLRKTYLCTYTLHMLSNIFKCPCSLLWRREEEDSY